MKVTFRLASGWPRILFYLLAIAAYLIARGTAIRFVYREF